MFTNSFSAQLQTLFTASLVCLCWCQAGAAQQLQPARGEAKQPLETLTPPAIADQNPQQENAGSDEPSRLLGAWNDRSSAENDSNTARPTNNNGLVSMISKLATSTCVVLVACVLCLVLFKRFGKGKFASHSGQQPASAFRILQSIRLGHRNVLQLVEAEGTKFVVGIDPTGIKSIVPVSTFGEFLDDKSAQIDSELESESDQDLLMRMLKRGFNFDSGKK